MTSNASALAESDYNSLTTTLDFELDETSQTVFLPIINDSTSESSETLNLTLSSPSSGATLWHAKHCRFNHHR
ncbi:MAG: hypothetical protein MSG64_19010 [Pyrinomonadaceae bacterium MAG19_C2-C3]|nr:hypothetical protein [Pyrinomonadaceae bacterium MAG19_C2-C3]